MKINGNYDAGLKSLKDAYGELFIHRDGHSRPVMLLLYEFEVGNRLVQCYGISETGQGVIFEFHENMQGFFHYLLLPNNIGALYEDAEIKKLIDEIRKENHIKRFDL